MVNPSNNVPHFTPGKRIKIFRTQKRLTRDEFCEITGIDFNHLQNIERGRVRPNSDTYEAMAKIWPQYMPWIIWESSEYTISKEDVKWVREKLFEIDRKYYGENNNGKTEPKKGR